MSLVQEDDENGDITDGIKENILKACEGIGQSNYFIIS